jgi:pantothenate kinase-related protein Tda10
MEAVIVCGPQGCGKTRNASALMNHFKLNKVVDDYVQGMPINSDTLYLSNEEIEGAVAYGEVIKLL